ncbi:oligosaccharide flippase family protein [Weissella confusa]|uniref:oligosaccharide flippase family protein n=1 Tax=Weissella confusa TaxID=1583 RepID=UPI002A74F683|nr:oligosaccharide flippase family protein [Weissella confusa]MDY2513073.1 oligosaccharide flippase family protein [Weissella confusa]
MKKLLSNYLYTLSYQIFLVILPLITLPYVSRVLGADGLGINAWGYSVSTYFVMVATLGLTTYGQREIADANSKSKNLDETFSTIEMASVITTVFALLLYLLFISIVPTHRTVLIIYGLSVVAVMFDVSWFFSGTENFKALALRNFFIKTISVGLIFILVKSRQDLNFYVLIQSGSIILSNLLLWPKVWKRFHFKYFKLTIVMDHIKGSIWLFFAQVSITFYIVFNKIVLGLFSSDTQLGYFDSADKLLRIVFSFFIAASTVLMPNIIDQANSGQIKRLSGMLARVAYFSFLSVSFVASGVVLMAPYIIHIVFGSKFSGMQPILAVMAMMLLPMSLANVYGNQILVPFKMTKLYTKSLIIGSGINLAIEVPLIYFWHATGAAVAVVVAETVVLLLQVFYARKILSLKQILNIKPVALFASVFGLVGSLGVGCFSESFMVRITFLFALVLMYAFISRKLIVKGLVTFGGLLQHVQNKND